MTTSSGRNSPKLGGGASGSNKRARSTSPTRQLVGSGGGNKSAKMTTGGGGSSGGSEPKSAGYLITCDVPTRQYITYLNKRKTTDKKFIIEELDATHLLVKKSAREEIDAEVERWMDENVFSAIERVGENLDMS